MAEFIPPLFSKFGKPTKDLFDYKFGSSLKVVGKTPDGLKLETKLKGTKSPSGNVSITHKEKTHTLEGNLGTGGDASTKLTLLKLAPNLKVGLSAGSSKGKLSGTASADYCRDYVSANFKAKLLTSGAADFDAGISIGTDGLSVGALAKAARSSKDGGKTDPWAFQTKDCNVGFQYEGSDYTTALFTKNWGYDISLAYHHKVSKKHQVGGQFDYVKGKDGAKDISTLTLGTKYQLDDNTTVSALCKTNKKVWVAFSHKLANPRLKVGVAAEFDSSALQLDTKKFGVNITMGDF
eukprot:CAMPEP_0205824824 /NCGR_PEP_ID=MMETSP0206-20130828/22874_1 /ASSEMBLY_ACC=CAM_ASM_000279 /TAXON_ID=36767 /ORGANISM="Euplotes focardii, Strain TN1" /LENGTH=292 /DNA_ID=CAMNT_0053123313 /DNA_START=28 /DNA_END=906 /DNA_ORIENTATION=-